MIKCPAKKTPWYLRTSTITGAFILIGPFVIPLVWLNKSYSLRTKIIATVIISVLSVVLIAAVYKSVKNILSYYAELNNLLNDMNAGNIFLK